MKALAAHGDFFASAAVAPQGASRWHLNQIYCECEAFTVNTSDRLVVFPILRSVFLHKRTCEFFPGEKRLFWLTAGVSRIIIRAAPHKSARKLSERFCADLCGAASVQKRPHLSARQMWSFCGAGDEARTRYLHLGKVALYRMSYTRMDKAYYSVFFRFVKRIFTKSTLLLQGASISSCSIPLTGSCAALSVSSGTTGSGGFSVLSCAERTDSG